MTKFLLLFLTIIIVGCASPARKLDRTLVDQIKEGVTMRSEVEKVFGIPERVVKGDKQRSLAFYSYVQGRPNAGWDGAAEGIAGTLAMRALTVLYHDETVETFLYDESSSFVRRNPEGLSVGREVSDETFPKIIKGITSQGELIQWLGAPTIQTLNLDGDRVLCWGFIRKGTHWRGDSRRQEFNAVVDKDHFVTDYGWIGSAGTLN